MASRTAVECECTENSTGKLKARTGIAPRIPLFSNKRFKYSDLSLQNRLPICDSMTSTCTDSVDIVNQNAASVASFKYPVAPVAPTPIDLCNIAHQGIQIDLMILYTRRAMCAHAGLSFPCPDTAEYRKAIEAEAKINVEVTNVAFLHSGVNASLNLVHLDLYTGYEYAAEDDPSNTDADLYRLILETGPNNLIMENEDVHDLRNAHQADVVAFIIDKYYADNGGGNGISGDTYPHGYASEAYSVVNRNSRHHFVFTHEMGHLFYSKHGNGYCNFDQANCPCFKTIGAQRENSTTPCIGDCIASSGGSFVADTQIIPRIPIFSSVDPSMDYSGCPILPVQDSVWWMNDVASEIAAFRPVANDVCENAETLVIDGNWVYGSTECATLDNVNACGGVSVITPGIWFTVIGNGAWLKVTTCRGTDNPDNFDSEVTVWSGACNNLVCVGGNQVDETDKCDNEAGFTWLSTNGVRYYILVSGTHPDDFNSFPILVYQPPLNNYCRRAEPLEINGPIAEGSTEFASVDPVPPCGGITVSTPGVWYSVDGNGEGLKVTTCTDDDWVNDDFDSEITVWRGVCNNLVCIGGGQDNEDGCGTEADFRWVSDENAKYYILVSGDPRNKADGFGIQIKEIPRDDWCTCTGQPYGNSCSWCAKTLVGTYSCCSRWYNNACESCDVPNPPPDGWCKCDPSGGVYICAYGDFYAEIFCDIAQYKTCTWTGIFKEWQSPC